MSAPVILRLRQQYESWNPGEVAGFDTALAARLVASGVATLEPGQTIGAIAIELLPAEVPADPNPDPDVIDTEPKSRRK